MDATMRVRQVIRRQAAATAYLALTALVLLGTSLAPTSPPGNAEAGVATTRAHAELSGIIARLSYQSSGHGDGDAEPRGGVSVGGESWNGTPPPPGVVGSDAGTISAFDSAVLAPALLTSRTTTTITVRDALFSSVESLPSRRRRNPHRTTP
jgi:hypothetical protein